MIRSRLYILAFSILLAACGGGDGDGAPTIEQALADAPIDSAAEAARAAGYIRLMLDLDRIADVRDLDDDFRGKAARAAMKFRLEDNCPGGGDFVIFDDNNPQQLTLQFNSCTNDAGERLDGQVLLQCQAGSFQDDSCSNTLITFGAGNRVFAFSDAQSSGSLEGRWRVITSSTSLRIEQSLELLGRNDAADVRIAAVTQNYFNDLEQDGNGGGLAAIAGSAGAAFDGPDADCATGLVTFTTLDRVQINAAGQLVGGRVRVSNQAGDSADVAFSADGAVTVTFDGGTQTFPRSQFERFCDLDLG